MSATKAHWAATAGKTAAQQSPSYRWFLTG
jgi:hypothetical protein